MKRVVVLVLLGLGGLVAATSLTLGALALAGDDVGSVVRPRLGDVPTSTPTASVTESPEPDRGGDDGSTSSPVTSAAASTPSDEGGGSSEPDSGEDGGSSDSSGPGSGEADSDSSGSGSGGSEDHSSNDD